jgi:hypothetical protein
VAPLEHASMKLCELCGVALLGVLEVVDGALAEEEAKHARDVSAANVMSGVPSGVQKSVDEAPSDPAQGNHAYTPDLQQCPLEAP